MQELVPAAVDAKEAARYVPIAPRRLKMLARTGRIPAFFEGNKWLFPVEGLRKWALERAEQQAERRQKEQNPRLGAVNDWLRKGASAL